MTRLVQATTAELEVRSVWVPLADGYLLLPNALVAEVVGYSPPEPIDKAPDWLLGRSSWRGENLPLISFERLIGRQLPTPGKRARIMVLYGLGDYVEQLPYYGLLALDTPRLLRASVKTLEPDPHLEAMPGIAQGALIGEGINQRPAWIPDVDYLAKMISQAIKSSV